MREANPGEVWEWCCLGDQDVPEHLRWEPILLLEKGAPSKDQGCHTWKALDLLTGDVGDVFNVPKIGWEKVE